MQENNTSKKLKIIKGAYKMYLLEKIKDGTTYKKGERIWATHPCKGWRIIKKPFKKTKNY